MGAVVVAAVLAGAGSPAAARAWPAIPGATHTARQASQPKQARHSARKRTSKLLLDVPRLELDAAIDIEPETGCHIERLEERHGEGVSDRGDEPGLGGCEAGKPAALEPENMRC